VTGPRAVAVVQRGQQVLVIKRHYKGRDYAVLPGPELEAHAPDNSFELRWAEAGDLDVLGLHPAHLRVDLPRLLGL
jgi:hypothetical protein